jgi:hypothetical protein
MPISLAWRIRLFKGCLILDRNRLKRLSLCDPGSRFAWPGWQFVGSMSEVALAADAEVGVMPHGEEAEGRLEP